MHKKSHGWYFFLKVEIKDQNNQIVKIDAKKIENFRQIDAREGDD